jgi:hypothetical protein
MQVVVFVLFIVNSRGFVVDKLADIFVVDSRSFTVNNKCR